MTRREFIAISDKMKVLAAEQMDEDAAVLSCTIFVQTKDKEAFEFATIRRDDGGHITEDGHGGILNAEGIFFNVGPEKTGALVFVPYNHVAILFTKLERSEGAQKNQN